MSLLDVPVVSLKKFTEGSDTDRVAFVETLGKAYEEIGFVSVVDHGIDDNLIDKLYHNVKDFFRQPGELKKKYEIEGLAGQRGYTSFGKESAKGSDVPDLKEFWQQGQYLEEGATVTDDYPDNVAVEEMPEFNEVLYKAYRQFEKAGSALLQAIAIYLDLDKNYFTDKISFGNSILRCIHYPPIVNEPKSAVRAEQHEDINLITLLVGASAEGLQLLTKKDEWMPVNAGPGQIVVNVGDMLQRLTNNKLRSTTHRVVNPPKEMWGNSRFSIPFFLHPRSEMKLDCLDNCITDANPLHYDPITAGGYLRERLIEIGLLKPEEEEA